MLVVIYKRLTYYAGYYLHTIEKNLNLQGLTPVDINHDSPVALYIGKGNCWSIIKQLNETMKRNQKYDNTRKENSQTKYFHLTHLKSYSLKSLLSKDSCK